MQPLNAVIATKDPRAAAELADRLNLHFRLVAVADSLEQMRVAVLRHRAQAAIVDLETVPLDVVKELCREFSHTSVVCTHRLADEEMWALALAAGAVDCCHNADVGGIVQAVQRNLPMFRSTAA